VTRHPGVGFLAILCIAASSAISPIASAQDAPVIDSVTLRKVTEQYDVVYPEFHVHDASGTVRYIHREVIATNSPKPLTAQDAVISISADQQMKGATFAGAWRCGPETYYVTLQAFMMNLSGLKSNVVEYTIHCNGG
jgi:hypothetical protein